MNLVYDEESWACTTASNFMIPFSFQLSTEKFLWERRKWSVYEAFYFPSYEPGKNNQKGKI